MLNFIDISPPTVVITAPVNLAVVAGVTSVLTEAIDNQGVDKVEFIVDGDSSTTISSAPFNWDWNTATTPNGLHTVLEKAYYAGGNAAISQLINCDVQNWACVSTSLWF